MRYAIEQQTQATPTKSFDEKNLLITRKAAKKPTHIFRSTFKTHISQYFCIPKRIENYFFCSFFGQNAFAPKISLAAERI